MVQRVLVHRDLLVFLAILEFQAVRLRPSVLEIRVCREVRNLPWVRVFLADPFRCDQPVLPSVPAIRAVLLDQHHLSCQEILRDRLYPEVLEFRAAPDLLWFQASQVYRRIHLYLEILVDRAVRLYQVHPVDLWLPVFRFLGVQAFPCRLWCPERQPILDVRLFQLYRVLQTGLSDQVKMSLPVRPFVRASQVDRHFLWHLRVRMHLNFQIDLVDRRYPSFLAVQEVLDFLSYRQFRAVRSIRGLLSDLVRPEVRHGLAIQVILSFHQVPAIQAFQGPRRYRAVQVFRQRQVVRCYQDHLLHLVNLGIRWFLPHLCLPSVPEIRLVPQVRVRPLCQAFRDCLPFHDHPSDPTRPLIQQDRRDRSLPCRPWIPSDREHRGLLLVHVASETLKASHLSGLWHREILECLAIQMSRDVREVRRHPCHLSDQSVLSVPHFLADYRVLDRLSILANRRHQVDQGVLAFRQLLDFRRDPVNRTDQLDRVSLDRLSLALLISYLVHPDHLSFPASHRVRRVQSALDLP